MSDVPSVNQEQKPVPDSEGSDKAWVDPIFAEINPDRLPDEPEPTAEDIAAQEAEEAAAAEAERKADGQPTKAELKKLIEDLPDDEPEEGAAKKPDGEAEADDDKAAEEAKKKAAEAEEEEGDGAEEAKDGAKKPRRRSRARRDRRAMERRLQEKDDEIARLKGQAPQPESTPSSTPAAEAAPQPKLEDFETADEWAAAFGNWTQAQFDAGKEQAAKAEQAKRDDTVRETMRKRIATYEERAEDMRDLHDDYDEVISDDTLTITPEMAEVIMESELGPQLAYHLGNNPEEAEKIAGLSPLAQAKALAKIETRLEAEQAAAETPKPEEENEEAAEAEEAEEATPKSTPAAAKAPRQTPTQAPEPITTVGGGGAQAKPDASKMSMADYYEGRLSRKIK